MTMLTKIGNSQGVRIPKPLIQQAHLENTNLEFEILENGLLIKPVNNSGRDSWKENIKKVLSKNKNLEDEAVLDDFLNDSDLEDYQW
ncbi:MAG: AbrB/MazE/SpoVT family DNA-binding domain-containing protein [Campylobacterota bacterium]|nr:AbrB/MazE/SpoVT family DNA-binding domain-containing protein [Campylobacterota bacterium]